MNSILGYVCQNWQQFGIDHEIAADQLTCLVLTPRFRASNHLISLVMTKYSSNPILVIKVPRQVDTTSLAQEAYNLSEIHKCGERGFNSIPRLLAYEPFYDRSILVETVLIGKPMDPAFIRRNVLSGCNLTLSWLVDMHQSTQIESNFDRSWHARLIEQPLDYFEEFFPHSSEEVELLNKTRHIANQFRHAAIPLVLEHGDLSHPNLLLMNNNQLGVLDWETANLNGLPFCDLFFFLNYAASSLKKAKSLDDFMLTFKHTFYDPKSWAIPYIKSYSEKLSISPQTTAILFVLCWARYSISLLKRVHGEQPDQIIKESDANWLRSNRFFSLWQYSVDHFHEFAFS